jgi:hypothetical protein
MVDSILFQRRLTWDDARAFENARVEFVVSDEEGAEPQAMQVIAVSERPAAVGGHQFSIAFRGPRWPVLPQRTYHVRHPSLGDFAIFITPVAQSAESTDFEACFAHVA